MTLVSQIITDAFRMSNLIAIGTTPTADEQTEALRYLNRIVKSVFGNEAGEQLAAFPLGDRNRSRPGGYPWYGEEPGNDWFVPKNVRLVLNLDSDVTVYLHPSPDDGSRFAVTDPSEILATNSLTVNGNGNRIETALSVLLNTNGLDSEWFYRADLANWAKYAPLVAADTFPFPEEFDDFFIGMLALRINPSYATMMDDQSSMMMTRSKSQLRARYTQNIPTPAELGLIRMSKMTADWYEWGRDYGLYNPNSMFNKGWPL